MATTSRSKIVAKNGNYEMPPEPTILSKYDDIRTHRAVLQTPGWDPYVGRGPISRGRE